MPKSDVLGYVYTVRMGTPVRMEILREEGLGQFLIHHGCYENIIPPGEDFEIDDKIEYYRYRFDAKAFKFLPDLTFTTANAKLDRKQGVVIVNGVPYNFYFLGLFREEDDISTFLVGRPRRT